MFRNLVSRLGSRTLYLPIGCMGLIFLLSSIPGGRHDLLGYEFQLAPRIGNFLHLPVYAVLATLWMVALEARGAPPGRAALLACIYATLFGAADEVHQHFVPLRCMDARDALANLLGAMGAALAWPWMRSLFFASSRAGEGGTAASREEREGPPGGAPGPRP
jgi:VanZ family protein